MFQLPVICGQVKDFSFISATWFSFRSRCLDTKFLREDHTGGNTANILDETLSVWELKANNQVCITTDSGANVLNAEKRLDWATKALKSDSRCSQVLAVCHKIVAALSGQLGRGKEN